MELRGLTIVYAKYKAKKGREKEMNIQKRLEELDKLISSPANTDHIIRQLKTEYATIKEDFWLIYENKAEGSILLSTPKQDGSSKVKSKPITFSIWKKGIITVR